MHEAKDFLAPLTFSYDLKPYDVWAQSIIIQQLIVIIVTQENEKEEEEKKPEELIKSLRARCTRLVGTYFLGGFVVVVFVAFD